MLSINSGFARAAVVSLVLVTAGFTAGCGVDVHAPSVRGTAYVRVEDVLKHHPLYSQLSQIDDAVAAITLEAAAPHVPLSASQLAAQTKALNQQLVDAQNRANKIIAQKQQTYGRREQQAISAAIAAAGIDPSAFNAAQMTATSAQQAQAAVSAASQDFNSYQQSVVAQDNAASSAIARQLQEQATQKLRAKAEQLQQGETDLSLRLTQQDAAARLAIKTRMSNLALDEATRKQLDSQLASLNAKESAAIETQRKADAATMDAYRAQIGAQTNDAIRSQVGAISGQTRAKIEERRNEVGAQIRSLGAPAVPAQLPPSVQAKIAGIHKRFMAQFQADAQKTVTDYQSTKADLDRQFQALHGVDVGATGAAGRELDSLQKRRDALQNQMVTQIQGEAVRLAKDRGFSIVFTHVDAAAGGYDLTNDLIKDVESLHE